MRVSPRCAMWAGEQRAADAVADRVHLGFAGCLLDRVERRIDALMHVVLEGLQREARVRVHPACDEDRVALVEAPLHQRLLGAEIEDVVLVDPGRVDDEGALVDLSRRRLVLDELHQVVLEDDLAGRGRDVLAETEGGHVRLLDLDVAVAALDVLEQMLHAGDEVLAVGGERRAQDFRIGEEEVRGRDGVRHLADVEVRLFACVRIDALGMLHLFGEPFAGEQVGLLHQIEDDVFLPVGIAEALVAAAGRGDGGHILAKQAARHVGGEAHIAFPEGSLRLDDFRRVGEVAARNIHQRLADALEIVKGVARVRRRIAVPHELPRGLLAEIGGVQEIDREAAEIGHHEIAGLGHGGGLFSRRFFGRSLLRGGLLHGGGLRGFRLAGGNPGLAFSGRRASLFRFRCGGRLFQVHRALPWTSLGLDRAWPAFRPVCGGISPNYGECRRCGAHKRFRATSVYYTLAHVRPMTLSGRDSGPGNGH